MGIYSGIVDLPAAHVVAASDLKPLTDLAKLTAETYNATKTLGQTVNNSTTLVNDTDLVLPMVANAIYRFECYAISNSNATADWKCTWAVPSGTTMSYYCIGYTTADVFGLFHSNAGTTQQIGGGGADRGTLMRGTVSVSSTPGNLQLQWAQNTLNASNTIVQAQSYLDLTRIA
jgi:hypothetical protein